MILVAFCGSKKMNNEIEYIEPTQEHVGQMVEVRGHNTQSWKKAKFYGLIGHDYKFIANDIDGIPISWKFARIPRLLTYAERQARCGLKVGDRVKFVRAWKLDEYSTTLEFIHGSGGMNKEVGQIGLITHIGKEAMQVQFAAQHWYLPYFVLEKVEDRVATCDDIGKQVYINGASGDIFTIDVIFGVEGDMWRAVVRSGDKRFVYELSNLRVKE